MAGSPRPKSPPSGGRVPQAVVDEVMARSKGRCELRLPGCRGIADCLHHRLRRSHGGSHTADNLLALDNAGCHSHVHAHVAEAYARGWMIRGVS